MDHPRHLVKEAALQSVILAPEVEVNEAALQSVLLAPEVEVYVVDRAPANCRRVDGQRFGTVVAGALAILEWVMALDLWPGSVEAVPDWVEHV